jgi:hypothetical protein
MPPKVQNARAGRKAAAAETPVATPAKKRGRPAKSQTNAEDPVSIIAERPKKRGRPSKITAEEVAPDASKPTKRGRKSSAPELAVPVATPVEEPPKARGGRPRKGVVASATPTPRKRGRPPKAEAVDLNRVAGTPRVSKRSSTQSAKAQSSKPAAVTSRLAPRMRSKLRTRLSPAKKVSKEEPAPQPARRGRPPKNAAPAAKKAAGHKATEVPVAKPTKSKPAAPRKMRGHTVRQIPDKYIAQVDQFLHDLMQADAHAAPVEQEQEQEQEQAYGTEVEADNADKESMEPTSDTTEDQAQEGEGVGTQFIDQQDSAEAQDSDSVTKDLAQSEAAFEESRAPEQDVQSKLNGEFDAPLDGNDEDGISVPGGDIAMPNADYDNSAESGQGPLSIMDQESYGYENPMMAATVTVG